MIIVNVFSTNQCFVGTQITDNNEKSTISNTSLLFFNRSKFYHFDKIEKGCFS